MKNILMISDDFLPAATGVGMHLQIICKELVREGHKVTVLTSQQGHQGLHETWEGVQIERCFSLKIAGFYQAIANPLRILKIVREKQIDTIHYHYLSMMMLVAAAVTRNLGLQKIYTYHMSEKVITQPWFMRPFRRLIGRGIVHFANSMDAVISPSVSLKANLESQGILSPIHFISNPLTQEFFQQKNVDKIIQSPFQILYAGRLNTEKNIPLLLRAFARHLVDFPQSHLWIAGKGDQEQVLKNLAQSLNITAQVQFLGFRSHGELANYYGSCDTFVLPSIEETQGMVVMEAMSFAKPVIVTKEIVSAEELVDSDGNGYIVDAFNPEDLATQLNHLASSPQTRARLGEQSLRKVKSYNPELVTAQLVSVYSGKDISLASQPELATQTSIAADKEL
jgi:glycosyltransferase involved in cell wall biosynthesis